jgi:hypothetical protein
MKFTEQSHGIFNKNFSEMRDLRLSQQRLAEVLKCFGGSIFHWNISKCLPNYMTSHPENSFFIKFSDNSLSFS